MDGWTAVAFLLDDDFLDGRPPVVEEGEEGGDE